MTARLLILGATLCVVLAGALLAPAAAAAKPSERKVGLKVGSDRLKVTFSYRDLFSEKVRKKMMSGLPVRVVVQVALENAKRKPVGYWARDVEIVYDLWEEDFTVVVREDSGRRRTRVATLDEAINVAGILWRAPVAEELALLKPGVYRLRVMAEVNPVSEEMIKNIQRWIARPKGGHGDSEARSNFFGSFVGYFVDRGIGQADRTVGFVSQWFKLGEE
jgi:hypothetical protein